MRSQARGVPTDVLIWTLIAGSATLCLLQALQNRNKHPERRPLTQEAVGENDTGGSGDHSGKANDQQTEEEEDEEEEEEEDEDEDEEEEEEEEENGDCSEDEGEEGHGGAKNTVADDEKD